MTAEWTAILAGLDDGFRLRAPATASDLDSAERALAARLPADLRDFYLLTDGLYDEPGQWFAIWPVAEVLTRNREAYALESKSRGAYIGFGDDGTGDPFCVPRDGGRGVFHWSPIDQSATLLHADVASLVSNWAGDTRD